MKRLLFLNIVLLALNVSCFSQGEGVAKSTILFTREDIATEFNYEKYKSDGIFWGHMPYENISDDWLMGQWGAKVKKHTSQGKYFFGRGEFDWGWQWMIDYMEDPGAYWAMDLDSNYIVWTNEMHGGFYHSWQSHHGPEFLDWLKYQVDRLLTAPVTHLMFDSQTSATRTLHWLAGDFSIHAMEGFRAYLAEKYTAEELNSRGIENIDDFNYRNFLLGKGFTLKSYKNQALSIEGNIPLYKDFVYFHRQVLNDIMEELFDYIDTKQAGIDIGVTTNLIEPRGFVNSDRLTYLAGEFYHPYNTAQSPPFEPIMHYKAAEYLDKTLVYFPYPDAFQDLQRRNAPGQARAWIAQAYAMGAIFVVPGDVWVGWSGTWDPGWENHAYIYEFIHDNSHLLDDYKAVSNVALTYSVYASLLAPDMDGSPRALTSLKQLINENISFDLQVFGDPDMPLVSSTQQLEQYEAIITDSDRQYFTTDQNKVLDSVASKVVSIDNPDKIDDLMTWKIDVLRRNIPSNDLISALPRISSHSEANYVLHLLNRKYNSSSDKAEIHNNITVKLPRSVYPNTITGAQLHLPDKPSVDISFQTDNTGSVELEIGTFESCWGIVELTHTASASGIANQILSNDISLYPNPANVSVTVQNESGFELTSVEVYNLQGRLVDHKMSSEYIIDVSVLDKGIYFVKICINDKVVTQRLIVD